ncbi:Protein kinase [Mycena indigotica]|uniref:Protein kinase n=1 Tax=Mycena indigotica TaxID=2126181 RepID=A0A8H6SW43_9AGAR|nr:Protein kinase [Mycena indigotica]KAF7307310.1 Protein kinase [Mycena indigotica]
MNNRNTVHHGPNGAHLCIVQEFLGPSFALDIERNCGSSYLPESTSSRLVGQLILAVTYLHKRGIAHGDLHAGNLLLCLPSSLDPDLDLTTVISNDWMLPSEPSPHKPRYLIVPISRRLRTPLFQACMATPSIKLCDFSESYMTDMADPPPLASPGFLLPPEGIFGELPHATLASDIWAVAVAIYQVLTSGCLLFYETDGTVLERMVCTLGKFPEPLWSEWADRAESFDEEGNPITDTCPKSSLRRKAKGWTSDEHKLSALAAMFETMLRYDAERRSPAGDLLQSEWMTKYCRPYMCDDVILPTERVKLINNVTYRTY